MIALEQVSKTVDGARLLEPTSLVVQKGEALALVGPSGAGKSTVVRLVVGLLAPDTGRVVVDGTPVSPRTVDAVRRRIGYVIQEGGLFPHLTACENATLLARHLGWTARDARARALELASVVRVRPDLLDRYPLQMSGGECQRIGILRALMLDPPVLVLDEPMAALDPLVRASLRADLGPIFRSLGKTVLLVTHDFREAAELGDTIAVMNRGAVVQRGTLRELEEAPADEFVRRFVDAGNGNR